VTYNNDFPLGAGTTGGTGTFVLATPSTAFKTSTLSLGANSVTISGAFQQIEGGVDGTGTLTVMGAASFPYVGFQGGTGTTDLKGATTINGVLYLDAGRVL
jgi:hypothetical protein